MLFPILIGITFISFFILQLAPGDAASMMAGLDATKESIEAIRIELGLDRPIIVQYGIFLKNVLTGDLGQSLQTQNDVVAEIMPRFINTIKLAIASMVLGFPIGLIMGAMAALRQNSMVDYVMMGCVLFGISVPIFWSGLIYVVIFSVYLGWFPSGGAEGFSSIVLPAVTMAGPAAAMTARMARSSLLEVFRQDYIKTARAKGLKESKVLRSHALKNAMIPTLTIIGIQFGYLLGGAVLVETVFTWPGLGRLIIESISARDYPVVQAGVMLFAFCFVLVNLTVDILYVYLDPRITYE